MKLPSWETYCDNTTAANALVFYMDEATVWFSYKTPVAFKPLGGSLTVRRNEWGPTTGKHLNAIDGGSREARKARVGGDEFEALLRGVGGAV